MTYSGISGKTEGILEAYYYMLAYPFISLSLVFQWTGQAGQAGQADRLAGKEGR